MEREHRECKLQSGVSADSNITQRRVEGLSMDQGWIFTPGEKEVSYDIFSSCTGDGWYYVSVQGAAELSSRVG